MNIFQNGFGPNRRDNWSRFICIIYDDRRLYKYNNMLVEKNKKEVKFLKSLGFKKIWFDDKSAYWYTLKIKDKYLKKLQITVQDFQGDGNITIDVADERGYLVTIVEKKYTRKKLLKLLDYFIAT